MNIKGKLHLTSYTSMCVNVCDLYNREAHAVVSIST